MGIHCVIGYVLGVIVYMAHTVYRMNILFMTGMHCMGDGYTLGEGYAM